MEERRRTSAALGVLAVLAAAAVAATTAEAGTGLVAPSFEQRLTPADDAERFGASVARGSDHLVVGAPGDDGGGSDAGAVHVYERNADGTWWRTDRVRPPGVTAGDEFGSAVAVAGDVMAVGAPSDDVLGQQDAGSVYVLEKGLLGDWSVATKLTSSPVQAGAAFGDAVDATEHAVVVGAPDLDRSGSGDAGGVFLATSTLGGWSEASALGTPAASPDDHLGHSVAVGDGRAAAGAPGTDTAKQDAGAVHTYVVAGEGLAHRSQLVASDASVNDRFGRSVDLDGPTLAIGAPNADAGVTDAGAVYVFVADGAWVRETRLTAEDAQEREHLGSATAVHANTVLSGAPDYDDGAASSSGRALAFARTLPPIADPANAWAVQGDLRPQKGSSFDVFGASADLSPAGGAVGAPFDGDGSAELYRTE